MIKEIVAPGIVVYKNILPESYKILDFVDQYDFWEPGIAAPSRDKKAKLGYPNRREVDVFGIRHTPSQEDLSSDDQGTIQYVEISRQLNKSLSLCIDDYIAMYGIDTIKGEYYDYQVLRYSKGHLFAQHTDDIPELRRAISGVYYFNDNYEGGELYFSHFGLNIKPKAFDYIVFPSMWSYSHEAREIISGTKFALVSFVD